MPSVFRTVDLGVVRSMGRTLANADATTCAPRGLLPCPWLHGLDAVCTCQFGHRCAPSARDAGVGRNQRIRVDCLGLAKHGDVDPVATAGAAALVP